MKWQDAPDKPGWWWLREKMFNGSTLPPSPFWVTDDADVGKIIGFPPGLFVDLPEGWMPIDAINGLWYGPIPEPLEDA
jgi:hypothetical protein